MKSVSIIATSYNQRPTLELLLASLERQTFRDFEMIVADDGSSDGTAELCAAYGSSRSFPIRFVTQPDEGYRKSRILNAAIRAAESDYVVFLDSDVIVERHFVEDHLELKRPDAFVCGRRVDLGPSFSATISLHSVRSGRFDRPQPALLMSAARGETEHVKRAVRIASAGARKALGYDREIDILGSNFGAWKKDLVAINGFNEALESYWGEDGDLYLRLRNTGKRSVSALGLCVQFHIWHKRRLPNEEQQRRYREMLEDWTYKWAERGLTKRDPVTF